MRSNFCELSLFSLAACAALSGCGGQVAGDLGGVESQSTAAIPTGGPYHFFTYDNYNWPVTAEQTIPDCNFNQYDLDADRDGVPGAWEDFNISISGQYGFPFVNIQSVASGLFLAAEGGGGSIVRARTPGNKLGGWEAFRMVQVSPQTSGSDIAWNLQTWNGAWVRAVGGGGHGLDQGSCQPGVDAQTPSNPRDWETFFVLRSSQKYTQGKCKCPDGSTRTCPVGGKGETHAECKEAVACACNLCPNGWGQNAGCR